MADRMLIIGESSSGKALADYEVVLTDKGWIPIGNIVIGDTVYDEVGEPTKVVKTHKYTAKIYRVHFKDGTFIDSCKDHKWKVGYDSHHRETYKIMSTLELKTKIDNRNEVIKRKYNRFFVPTTLPVQHKSKELPLHPYLLGVLLGDGYIPVRGQVSFSNTEKDIIEKTSKLFKEFGLNVKKYTDKNYNYTLVGSDVETRVLKTILKDLGLLGRKSKEKFIPEMYLRSSEEDRRLLLQGLIDTDGCINNRHYGISFSTMSIKLKENVKDLATSLGIITTIHIQDRTKDNKGVCYEIGFQTKEKIWSSEKHQRRFEQVKKHDRHNNGYRLFVTHIEELDDIVPMTCLEVDSPYHTFLTKNHIVTHNSSSLRSMSPSDTIVIKCFNKRLPFKNGDNKFKVYTPQNYEELVGAIVDIIEKDKNKKVKNIVIDDIIYFMSDEFMKTINVKGFEKFSNMASGLYGAFKDIPDLLLKDRPDILVTFMTHATVNELGNISIRTIGKLIDEKVKLEGMFEMVLLAKMNEDGRYVFQVHNMNNSKSVVKTPMGMFESDEIDNDLAYVIQKRNEYYGIEESKKEAK